MNATTLARAAGLDPMTLLPYTNKKRATIYAAWDYSPPPQWLLSAFFAWYKKNGPIKPATFDTAFLTEFEKAREALIGIPSMLRDLVTKTENEPSPNSPKGTNGKQTRKSKTSTGALPKAIEPSVPAPNSGSGLRKDRVELKQSAGIHPGGGHVGDVLGEPEGTKETISEEPGIRVASEARDKEIQKLPSCWSDTYDHYKLLVGSEAPNIHFEALIKHLQVQPWAFDRKNKPRSRSNLMHILKRKTGVTRRKRSKNIRVQNRDVAMIELLGPMVMQRMKNTHDKGAGPHSLGSRRAIIRGVRAEESVQGLLKGHIDIGYVPSISVFERVFLEKYGPAPHEYHKDHLQKCVGFNAKYPWQVAVVDATGYPVRFTHGQQNGKHKRWIYLCVDVASASILAANIAATSESEGWRPQDNPYQTDVMLQFWKQLNLFPEYLINDAVSTLTDGIRHLKPGMHPAEKLSAGVILALAGGTKPYVRMGGRPTGGATAERHVRTTKDKLAELGSKDAIAREIRGEGLRKINDCSSALDFLNRLTKAIAEINAGPLKRRGCPESRNVLAAKRQADQDKRRAHPTLWLPNEETGVINAQRIVAASRVGIITKGRVNVQTSSGPWAADLIEPECGWKCKTEERVCLVQPTGARAIDGDQEEFRVLMIEEDGHHVEYHPCTAKSVQLDEFYQDKSHPYVGQYKALPDTTADQFSRNRNADAAAWRKDVAERKRLRQGTTGDEVEYDAD